MVVLCISSGSFLGVWRFWVLKMVIVFWGEQVVGRESLVFCAVLFRTIWHCSHTWLLPWTLDTKDCHHSWPWPSENVRQLNCIYYAWLFIYVCKLENLVVVDFPHCFHFFLFSCINITSNLRLQKWYPVFFLYLPLVIKTLFLC